jgi:UDP-glucose 4-epimerase
MAISTQKELFSNGAVSFRLSNTFGLPIVADSSGWTLVVNEWCRDAITTKSIHIRSSPNLSRNFIPLRDAAREIVEASTDFGWVPENDFINLGSSQSFTLEEVALLIKRQTKVDLGIDVEIKKVSATSGLSLLQFNSIYRPMRNHDFRKSVSDLLQKCASDFGSGLTDGI